MINIDQIIRNNNSIRTKFKIKLGDPVPYTGRVASVREDLYDLFHELGFTHGAEVGVATGGNALQMFDRIAGLELICVDPYKKYERTGQAHITRRKERAEKRLKISNVIWMQIPSMEAVNQVADRSLDFVYIDGVHLFDHVMMDIICWSQKVKVGGIVSGHDYYFSTTSQVPRAVDAYVLAHGIRNMYLTRDTDMPPSWFWVNE